MPAPTTLPTVVIRPPGGRVGLGLRELWDHRELLFVLARRDVSVRYKQTALGALWAILQPLVTMAVFTVIFSRMAHVPSNGIPYPLFSYAALLPWTFVANAVTASSTSIVGSSQLITKVYFPRLVIPGAAVLAGLVDFGIAFLMLIALMIYYGAAAHLEVLLVPALLAFTILLALGIGTWAAAMNVKYRDFRHALPLAIQLWMFATPVIYPTSLVQARWRWVLSINPLTGLIESFRVALFGGRIPWGELGLAAIVTCLVAVYAAYAFRRMERGFADVI